MVTFERVDFARDEGPSLHIDYRDGAVHIITRQDGTEHHIELADIRELHALRDTVNYIAPQAMWDQWHRLAEQQGIEVPR